MKVIGRGMLAPFCLALGLGGSGCFVGACGGAALTEHTAKRALAREVAALQAKHATEAKLLACQFPVRQARRKR